MFGWVRRRISYEDAIFAARTEIKILEDRINKVEGLDHRISGFKEKIDRIEQEQEDGYWNLMEHINKLKDKRKRKVK